MISRGLCSRSWSPDLVSSPLLLKLRPPLWLSFCECGSRLKNDMRGERMVFFFFGNQMVLLVELEIFCFQRGHLSTQLDMSIPSRPMKLRYSRSLPVWTLIVTLDGWGGWEGDVGWRDCLLNWSQCEMNTISSERMTKKLTPDGLYWSEGIKESVKTFLFSILCARERCDFVRSSKGIYIYITEQALVRGTR